MSYFQLRLAIYHHQLRQWLASLKQQSLAVIAFMPLAWPALIFIVVYIIGQLAEPDSDKHHYLAALWLYQLFTYCLVYMQRDGINGSRYQHYLNSVAATPRQRAWSELALLIYAANILLLGPLLLLAVMLHHGAGQLFSGPLSSSIHNLYPLCGALLLTSYYAVTALRHKRLPVFSLLIWPMLIWPLQPFAPKYIWLISWFIVILLERYTLPAIPLPVLPVNNLAGLLLVANLRQPRNDILRLTGIVLLILLGWQMFDLAAPAAQPYLHSIFSLLLAMLTASSLFDQQRVCHQYQYYLHLAGYPPRRCMLMSVVYVVGKSVLLGLLISLTGVFTLHDSILWFIFNLVGIVSIPILSSRFFLLPLASWILITWLS